MQKRSVLLRILRIGATRRLSDGAEVFSCVRSRALSHMRARALFLALSLCRSLSDDNCPRRAGFNLRSLSPFLSLFLSLFVSVFLSLSLALSLLHTHTTITADGTQVLSRALSRSLSRSLSPSDALFIYIFLSLSLSLARSLPCSLFLLRAHSCHLA